MEKTQTQEKQLTSLQPKRKMNQRKRKQVKLFYYITQLIIEDEIKNNDDDFDDFDDSFGNDFILFIYLILGDDFNFEDEEEVNSEIRVSDVHADELLDFQEPKGKQLGEQLPEYTGHVEPEPLSLVEDKPKEEFIPH